MNLVLDNIYQLMIRNDMSILNFIYKSLTKGLVLIKIANRDQFENQRTTY